MFLLYNKSWYEIIHVHFNLCCVNTIEGLETSELNCTDPFEFF